MPVKLRFLSVCPVCRSLAPLERITIVDSGDDRPTIKHPAVCDFYACPSCMRAAGIRRTDGTYPSLPKGSISSQMTRAERAQAFWEAAYIAAIDVLVDAMLVEVR